MSEQLLKYFECPECHAAQFKIRSATSGYLGGTSILCCQSCAKTYPIRDGVPRFISDQNYADSFGYQWTRHRRTQLDSYSGLPISRQRLFESTGWPTDMTGHLILEAGCGAGRFTECLLRTGADIISCDYSSAIESNWRNNGHEERLQLLQGDIRELPLRKGVFDKVLCLGVLQHTPFPAQAFRSLCQFVKPGGEIVIDVYEKKVSTMLSWKYALRPITRRVDRDQLYEIVSRAVEILLPVARRLRQIGGRGGARLVPIVEYSHLGLPRDLNTEWAILDTFDMYSPAYDHPQTIADVRDWCERAGLADIIVRHGKNGIVAKGRKKALSN